MSERSDYILSLLAEHGRTAGRAKKQVSVTLRQEITELTFEEEARLITAIGSRASYEHGILFLTHKLQGNIPQELGTMMSQIRNQSARVQFNCMAGLFYFSGPSKHLENARAYFSAASSLSHDCAIAHFYLAQITLQMHDFNKAGEHCRKFMDAHTGAPSLYLDLAEAIMKMEAASLYGPALYLCDKYYKNVPTYGLIDEKFFAVKEWALNCDMQAVNKTATLPLPSLDWNNAPNWLPRIAPDAPPKSTPIADWEVENFKRLLDFDLLP